MSEHVLITGGAGFIGSHLADRLLRAGHRVRALDNLSPQVHGPTGRRPDYLDGEVELVVGDVRDPEVVGRALDGVDSVVHLAAAVGVGQSMYEVADYTAVNNMGTAVLLQRLLARPVRRLVVASSMSLYGEGLYQDAEGRVASSAERTLEQLRAGDFEVRDARGAPLTPLPTPEWKSPALASIYALSKFDQERMCLLIGRAYGIETVALRFFNVFGTRQALSNPYTGVLAIFASRLLNGNRPRVFEDGLQRRDFVSVYDVAQACERALAERAAAGEVFNVGSGRSYSIVEVAQKLAAAVGREDLAPEITAEYRVGDIRHCFSDITRAAAVLGYSPTMDLDEGLVELASWLEGQAAVDRVAEASAELSARGLTLSARPALTGASAAARGGRSASAESASRRGEGAAEENGRGVHERDHVARPPQEDRELARTVRREPANHRRGRREQVVVTGGAGFIGSNLAHRLLSEGERVLILDDLSRPGVRRNLDWLRSTHGDRVATLVADVREAAAVQEAVARASSVFHLAAQVAVTTSLDDPRHDLDVNVLGTLNVLEALRALASPPPLLFTSTNKVYGSLADVALRMREGRYEPAEAALRERGISEERPLDFHSPYGCSKGAADQYVRDYARSFGLPTVVFRMSCIYGPRQFGTEDQGWIAHFLIRALRGEPVIVYGDGRQVRDALFVSDLVDAMLLAREKIDRTAGEVYNIGGGPQRTTSLLELLARIESLTGHEPPVEHADWRTGDQQYFVTDTQRFALATGWTPRVRLDTGLERLYQWLRDAGAQDDAQWVGSDVDPLHAPLADVLVGDSLAELGTESATASLALFAGGARSNGRETTR